MGSSQVVVPSDVGELIRAGLRLRAVDPVRFAQMLELIQAYVSLYDAEPEDSTAFLSRLAAASPGDRKASA